MTLPPDVLRAATGVPVAEHVCEEPLVGSSGAATAEVVRLAGTVSLHGESRSFSIIRKTLRPVTAGRHAEASKRPDHWAYWRREPTRPDCRPPGGGCGHLDASASTPARSTSKTSPARTRNRNGLPSICDCGRPPRKHRAFPGWPDTSSSSGDYSVGNLIADEDDTVAIDWGTVGVAPAGADLAHLALSSLADPMPAYLKASSAGPAEQDVLLGYQTTMALTGASRLHWMLSNQVPVPDDYVDFVWAHRPRLLRSRRV